MADAPIRLALAGCGIGAQHLEAYAALPGLFDVTTLVDRDPHRARDLADRFAIPRTVADLDALWTGDEPPVEAVDICLPPMAHEAAIKSALDHGAHVVCENRCWTPWRALTRSRHGPPAPAVWSCRSSSTASAPPWRRFGT